MKILGIDYGTRKVGLALAESDRSLKTFSLAEPYKVLFVNSQEEMVEKISSLIKKDQVGKVVVGISEGKMARETKTFSKKLKDKVDIPVVFQDETMSSKEAEILSIQANIRRKKRRRLKDAYSAVVILQNYLDSRR
jgi:putative Holliday junction resolvase